MTDAIDPRIVRLSLEIDGQFHVFEGLDITARGRKTANPKDNSCEVRISNLTKHDRDYILTATSPFIANRRSPKRMIVEAGRASVGVTRLFYGDITSSQITQPPDIGLELRFQTCAHQKGQMIVRAGRETQSLSAISADAAKDLGLSLTFEADDRLISNHSFAGPALRQVDAISDTGGVDAYVDDTTLVVKNAGAGLKNRVRVLNKNTGMIGVPEFTERGLRVKSLIDASTVLGGTIQVESELNPAVNGDYVVYCLDFDIASRAQQFYFIAEARRAGQIVKAKHGHK